MYKGLQKHQWKKYDDNISSQAEVRLTRYGANLTSKSYVKITHRTCLLSTLKQSLPYYTVTSASVNFATPDSNSNHQASFRPTIDGLPADGSRWGKKRAPPCLSLQRMSAIQKIIIIMQSPSSAVDLEYIRSHRESNM